MRSISPNRITFGGATVVLLLMAALLAGCGGGGSSTARATEAAATEAPARQSPDGELLNKVLAREEGAVAAYAAVIPHLSPRLARMASYFRAQEQEHVDAVVKALRGLKAPAEATPEAIEPGEAKTAEERLVFLYEVEGATIDEELSAISNLEAPWPRSLLASTVADQAQHLTLIRQALGAGPLASVPVPFENGTAPPPE
ncbi:MAG TPA: ferritin-like domain-containing protein [Solirubrobacterales bacterium]|nr:ferritin-like domain-containing protein [Solirubrobacterales bacterium]